MKVVAFLTLALSVLLPVAEAAPPKAALDITIDRIDISGVSSLPRSEIESAMELNPGDRLERVKVVRTAENLQAIYNAQGFEQVTIKTRLLREKNPEGQF